MLRFIFSAVAGAALAYFIDPDHGRRRRNIARDRALALMRRASWRVSRWGRWTVGAVYGVGQEMAHAPDIREALDDATLARKIESEVFRDRSIAKGGINVNVEEGVVVLRGLVDRPDDILRIEAAVRRIPDVLDVQNLLHLPGAPAPNKAEAMSAERPPRRARTARTKSQATNEPSPPPGQERRAA
jgi:hypothetical protein